MLTVREVIEKRRAVRQKPSDEELRSLPDRKALIYGRVSSPGQVRDSEESIREIAYLVELAKADGFRTTLEPPAVEAWLKDIQMGAVRRRVLDDAEVIVDCQDLGISATTGQERRLGLANVKALLEHKELGSIYLSEPSRLSRDQDKVEPYVLLKLMKDGNCKVRTLEGVLSPFIERDWDILDEEFEDARDEMKVWRRRLHRKKLRKAERGEYVGGPVPAGFYLPIVEQRKDGRYIFGKMAPYEPHAQIVNRILQEFVCRRSPFDTVRTLKEVTFPFFPPQMAYMESRTALRPCPKTPNGYAVTVDLLYGLAKNLALIGVWVYGDIVIEGSHDAIVTEELFWQAYEVANSRKPRGRAAYYEPLPFEGLLYCGDHAELQRISTHNSDRTYICANDYRRGIDNRICLHVTHQVIDTPLLSEVLSQLDMTPYAEEVLAKLEAEATEEKLGETGRKRQKVELEATLANLRANLGRTQNPELVTEYERQILQVKEQLASLNIKRPPVRIITKPSIYTVRDFLTNLRRDWDSYPATLKNRLLNQLVEMVELRHEREHIDATIIWKAGFQQGIRIHRPPARGSREKRWSDQELALLRMLWPSSNKEVILAALPERSWSAIGERALRLGLNRKRDPYRQGASKHWTEEEKAKLTQLYEAGVPIPDIAAELGRGQRAIVGKAAKLKLRRPREVKWRQSKPTWSERIETFNGSKQECLEHLSYP